MAAGSTPRRLAWLLAGLAGLNYAVTAVPFSAAGTGGDGWRVPLLAAPFLGVAGLYAMGLIVWWAGRRLGGGADRRWVLAVVAWSQIPAVAALCAWIVLLSATVGGEPLSGTELASLFGIGRVVAAAMGVWTMVALVAGIAEVHGLGLGRAAATVALAGAALALGVALAGLGACERTDRSRVLAEAEENSRRLAAAEWSYGVDTLPPEPGDTAVRTVERCRVIVGGEEPRDVACGQFLVALEADVDSAWVERLTETLGLEVVERRTLPGWTTRLGEPIPYLLVSVPVGAEAEALRRTQASEGVRFVDVPGVRRRRP